ncbi:MAG: helix-turn-helix domain-containing protein [Solirubrobacteraceae bacterium]|nr:helix-turn-helix domain-containing protein [Solirubrobacteraceae bacterium]
MDTALSPEVLGALRATADRVGDRLDAVAQQIADVLHAEEPDLPGDPQTLHDTSRASREIIRSFLWVVRTGMPVASVRVPSDPLDAARGRARAGLALVPLLRLCHLGHGAFLTTWDHELSRLDAPPAVLMEASAASQRLSFSWMDSMSRQLAAAYDDERRSLAVTGEAHRAQTIRAILSGDAHDVDGLSRLLGHDLRRHHVGVLAWTTGSGDPDQLAAPLRRAVVEVAETLGGSRPLVMSHARAVLAGWVAIADPKTAAAAIAQLTSRARADRVSIALGEPAFGVPGFRATHRDAQDAFRVAILARRRLGSVVSYRKVELAALASEDLSRVTRFVRDHLGPLAADDDEHSRLRATLRLFVEERGSRVGVARRLGIHANTVGNRVRACEELLGREVAEHGVELHVALALAQTLGAPVLTTVPEAQPPSPRLGWAHDVPRNDPA